MAGHFPYGSCLIVAPMPVRDGDFVVAWACDYCAPDNPSNRGPAMVVKQLAGDRLVSTDTPGCLDKFEVRGKVLCCLQVQKLLRWRAANSNATAAFTLTPECRERYRKRMARAATLLITRENVLSRVARPVEPRATNLSGFKYDRNLGLICLSGGGRATFPLSDKPVKVYAVSYRGTCVTGSTWIGLGTKRVQIVPVTDPVPMFVRISPAAECTKAEMTKAQGSPLSNGGTCSISMVRFWIDK